MTIYETLYQYLLAKGDEWTPQVQVARDLFAEFGNGECCLEPKNYHDTTERKLLSNVISIMNTSPEFEKIIISSRKGIKIANEDEFFRYIKGRYSALFRQLKKVRAMERKGDLHGQLGIDGAAIDSFIEKF